MYDRLTATLGHSDIDEAVTRAIVLQLVGAPTRSTELGADIRGDIHLAIVSDTAANFSHFFLCRHRSRATPNSTPEWDKHDNDRHSWKRL